MWFISIVGLAVAIVVMLLILNSMLEKKVLISDLNNRHVVITGGSSGIGLSAAKEVARLGAHISIIGRDSSKLNSAVEEIKQCAKNTSQKIQSETLDVTSEYEKISSTLSDLEKRVGPVFMLINCAGSCICGRFEDMSASDIRGLMNLNYFGTAFTTKYVLPGMKARGEGRIVFVSSEAALLGIYGLSAYSGAKWAVRGLAESVAMELVGSGVHLTLSFPPDTDTPGYHAENEGKPEETKLIANTSGLLSSDEVGRQLVRDALAGKMYSVVAFGGNLMSLLFCGSVESVWQVLIQVFSMGLLRIVFVCYILSFNSIVRNELKKRIGQKSKSE